jgi:hypothetical protein
MKFSEFISQNPNFDRGTENHGAMVNLADGSYIIITKASHEYAAPADGDVFVDAGRYCNPDGDEEECLAWEEGLACEALREWVMAQERAALATLEQSHNQSGSIAP